MSAPDPDRELEEILDAFWADAEEIYGQAHPDDPDGLRRDAALLRQHADRLEAAAGS